MSVTEAPRQPIPLPDVIKAVETDLGSQLRMGGLLRGGVSGSKVYKAELSAGGSVAEVVLKHDVGVGGRETGAQGLVGSFLCLPEALHFGDDHILYRFIPGPTVDTAVRARQMTNGAAPFDEFVQVHAGMWKETLQGSVALGGYAGKVAQTEGIVEQTVIRDESGRELPLSDLRGYPLVVNGVEVGTLGSALEQMGQIVGEQQRGVMSHGDEGATNAIIEQGTDRQVMIDHGTAALRAVGEPIAKILLWFDATVCEDQGYELIRNNGRLILNTRTGLPDYIQRAVASVREKLEPWLSTSEERRAVAAYMMMYLFRELQWLAPRGRGNMVPHLLAKALSFAPAMEGKVGGFPLTFKD